ncbi:hypothetical protein PAPYR_2490 [Paratrimastix pyriformis]|uniref:Uncharacterized protein n=1 Tax=Paratrimastix pyriformis TaxID=342808 RepID=A0ABQ8UQD2_9EUKA|nr:hypothetical protein PAPYR_2490 [Paratrimastix pyriformis]
MRSPSPTRDFTSHSPISRVAPAPVTRGLSVRSFPTPNFATIRQTCQHYEAKNAGNYCHACRASRFLYDLSHEIQDQLLYLEKEDTRKNTRLHHMSTVIAEWERFFGSPHSFPVGSSMSSPRDIAFPSLTTPGKVYRELERLQKLALAQEKTLSDQVQHTEATTTLVQQEFSTQQAQHETEMERQYQDLQQRHDKERAQDAQTFHNMMDSMRDAFSKACEELIGSKDQDLAALRAEYEERMRVQRRDLIEWARTHTERLTALYNQREALTQQTLRELSTSVEKESAILENMRATTPPEPLRVAFAPAPSPSPSRTPVRSSGRPETTVLHDVTAPARFAAADTMMPPQPQPRPPAPQPAPQQPVPTGALSPNATLRARLQSLFQDNFRAIDQLLAESPPPQPEQLGQQYQQQPEPPVISMAAEIAAATGTPLRSRIPPGGVNPAVAGGSQPESEVAAYRRSMWPAGHPDLSTVETQTM